MAGDREGGIGILLLNCCVKFDYHPIVMFNFIISSLTYSYLLFFSSFSLYSLSLSKVFLLSAAFVVPPKVLSVPLYFNDRGAFDAAADSLSDLEKFRRAAFKTAFQTPF